MLIRGIKCDLTLSKIMMNVMTCHILCRYDNCLVLIFDALKPRNVVVRLNSLCTFSHKKCAENYSANEGISLKKNRAKIIFKRVLLEI